MLILSGKEALQKQIGDIHPLEKSIDEYIRLRRDYEIIFCYYDKAGAYGFEPVSMEANAIRAYIMELEEKLGDFDFLLLLGGDEVVPFFRLDNPCDDADESVLSDNPYASRDENYTIPERVCARIPDNRNAAFMTSLLARSKAAYGKSFGLSAHVWLRASENVYQSVGDPKELNSSPPVTSDVFESSWLENKDYLYFNVHGSKVSPNWYGQKGGEYPVAMHPGNIRKASGVVASEACYGAYILNKNQDNAISLKFLDADDILCFCGSTTIAYGPVQPPSSEADLFVKYFFEYAQQGITVGQSFTNAKLDFARKALRRHGFLDDDDQKTLLQFVFYGDPTLRACHKEERGQYADRS
jgi:hypothetical protein